MSAYWKGILYSSVVDPMLASLHRTIVNRISSSDKVIDFACGPGTLAMVIADYNCPMTSGIYRSLAYGIEKIAGGDH